jgi:hypothetical protein
MSQIKKANQMKIMISQIGPEETMKIDRLMDKRNPNQHLAEKLKEIMKSQKGEKNGCRGE